MDVGVDCADEEGAAGYVAEGGGDEVGGDGFQDADIGSFHHAKGDEKHVGDGVFVAQGHEGHDGNPAAERLFKEGLSGEGEPYGQTDTPVGAYTFEKYRQPRHRYLCFGYADD